MAAECGGAMTGRVAGKAVIVFGAGAIGPGLGNGKAAAIVYAREGASVLCVDRSLAAAEETARQAALESEREAARLTMRLTGRLTGTQPPYPSPLT